jgi:hypothetical protein
MGGNIAGIAGFYKAVFPEQRGGYPTKLCPLCHIYESGSLKAEGLGDGLYRKRDQGWTCHSFIAHQFRFFIQIGRK